LVTCALLYGAAWACLLGVRAGSAGQNRLATNEGRSLTAIAGRLLHEFRDGVGAVRASRTLVVVVAVWGLYMVADVPFSAVFPAFLSESLDVGPEALGLMMTIRGLTGVAGGFLVVWLSRRVDPTTLLAGGLLAYGASIAGLGVINEFGPGLWLTLANGPGGAAVQTGLATTLQRNTAPGMRGRVFSLVGIVNGVIVILASLAAGSLGEVAGSRAVVILSGSLQLLPFLLVLALMPRRVPPVR